MEEESEILVGKKRTGVVDERWCSGARPNKAIIANIVGGIAFFCRHSCSS
jgi:hypothetical protein